MRIAFAERKGDVLSHHGPLPCMHDVPCINVTRGCSFKCSYCAIRPSFARGAPDIVVYTNLAEKLEAELARHRHRPTAVYFSPSCDPFQPQRQVLAATYGAMKALLENRVGVMFTTLGVIPASFIKLFEQHAPLVQAQITLTTTVHAIQKAIEHNAAPPAKRLDNIRQLQAAGVNVEVRIEPLIPALTDIDLNLHRLFDDLAPYAPLRAPVSYMFLRGHNEENLRDAFNRGAAFQRVLSYYDLGYKVQLENDNAEIRVLPPKYRTEKYAEIRAMAEPLGIDAFMCSCKNPDLSRELRCRANRDTHYAEAAGQHLLFAV